MRRHPIHPNARSPRPTTNQITIMSSLHIPNHTVNARPNLSTRIINQRQSRHALMTHHHPIRPSQSITRPTTQYALTQMRQQPSTLRQNTNNTKRNLRIHQPTSSSTAVILTRPMLNSSHRLHHNQHNSNRNRRTTNNARRNRQILPFNKRQSEITAATTIATQRCELPIS